MNTAQGIIPMRWGTLLVLSLLSVLAAPINALSEDAINKTSRLSEIDVPPTFSIRKFPPSQPFDFAAFVPLLDALQTMAAPVPRTTILFPGDVLELHWWGAYQAREVALISADGICFAPQIGELPLAGHTLAQAEILLQRETAKYFNAHVHSGVVLMTGRPRP